MGKIDNSHVRPAPSLEEYHGCREIAREPHATNLSPQDITAMTRTVFVPSVPEASDVLFVFGSSEGRWELVVSLFEQGLAPLVLVAGRAGEDFYATGQPQAHRIRKQLVSLGVPENLVLVEDQSDNTLENVLFGRSVLENHGTVVRSILFVCKSHHGGRAWRTLARGFPAARLSCVTYDTVYGGVMVSRDTWYEQATSRARVYGEFKRIELYAARGDIADYGPSWATD